MKTADGTVDGTGQVIGIVERRLPQLLRLRPVRPRVPDHVQRADRRGHVHRQLRPAARHRLVLGRQLRQPGRPVPGRHGLPGRAAAQPDHGPRLLHPYGHRGLGLPQRHADRALDVRLEQRRQRSTPARATTSCPSPTWTPTARTRSSTARWPIDDNGQPLWNTGSATATPCTSATSIPSRPGPGGVQGRRGHRPAGRLDGRRPDRRRSSGRTPRCGCDNGRGVSDDVYAGSPGAESWSSAVSGLYNTSGQNIGRKPGSTNFLAWWDGDPVRELLDGTHIDKYGTGGDTRLLTGSGVPLQQRHQVDPVAVRRPVRRLARGGRLADHRQPRAADLHHADADRPADLHAAARHPVPGGHRLAEHRVQPAAAPELLHRQRHGHAAAAEHLPGRITSAGWFAAFCSSSPPWGWWSPGTP